MKVIRAITNSNTSVLISSQWQVPHKIKLNLKHSTANTQDKICRLKGEWRCHDNGDPNTLKTTGETMPAGFSSENRMRERPAQLPQISAFQKGLLDDIRPPQRTGSEWYVPPQPRGGDGRMTNTVTSRLTFPKGDPAQGRQRFRGESTLPSANAFSRQQVPEDRPLP